MAKETYELTKVTFSVKIGGGLKPKVVPGGSSDCSKYVAIARSVAVGSRSYEKCGCDF